MKRNFFYCCGILSIILYSCNNNAGDVAAKDSAVVVSPSWALLPFTKLDSANPVLVPGKASFVCPVRQQSVFWEEKDVFNPAVAVRNDSLFLLYRAQDRIGKPAGTSRIGLAVSTDGMHFTKRQMPVLYPANDAFKKFEWEGGCEDPRLVQDSAGTYYMTYTAFDGKQARLFIATSTDLLHWKKYGCVFAKAFNGRYMNVWSKSGSIVSTYNNGKITAVKINGKYWMYWGDKYIWAAISDDLINWEPVEKPATDTIRGDMPFYGVDITRLQPVIMPRPGKFDNDLVESGPPAMLTNDGIVLLYNGRNVPATGDKSLPEGAYTSCQVLLDKTDPTHIVDRMTNYFMKPGKPYELTGQVNQVCFIEGLAQFKNKWWLYYGTADSKIAVTVK
ncbi:MAG TPA: glycoside hydrolase family 130 protein [Chitinophagaceae bacterium]|nr:glycoside hydrolase family 130 protein [Chitinophagaceae bacterium]